MAQNRPATPDAGPIVEHPRDRNLHDAVARMTKAARAQGKERLLKSESEWQAIVLARIRSRNINMFSKDVMKLVGKVSSVEEANLWLGLATNIWNNTPQPDRGGKTASELVDELYRSNDPDKTA